MTTAAYTGRVYAEWRAACPIHSIKSEVQPDANAAAMLAADTRAFCPVCRDEAAEAKRGRWAQAVITAMRGGLETAVSPATADDDELTDGLLDMVF